MTGSGQLPGLRHRHVAKFQRLHLLGLRGSRRGLGRRHWLGGYGLNRFRRSGARRRADFMLDLASRYALFFLLDFHHQILSGSNVLALMAGAAIVAGAAFVARAILFAVMTAAATAMPTKESE